MEELAKEERELADRVGKMVVENVGKGILVSTLNEGIPPTKLPSIFAIASTTVIVLIKLGHLKFGSRPMTREEAEAFLKKYEA